MVARPGRGPRRLYARSLDAVARGLLSSELAWRVHSSFEQAANLRSGAGDLLGLAIEPAPDAPSTGVLRRGDIGRPLSADLRPGMAVEQVGGLLTTGDSLEIDVASAALWSLRPIKRSASI